MTESPESRTGLFHQKSTDDYVVLWEGREICRYKTIDDFIGAHASGLEALDTTQAELLESYYRGL